jgi:uncharacterized protein YjbI with pentapeptide repeats
MLLPPPGVGSIPPVAHGGRPRNLPGMPSLALAASATALALAGGGLAITAAPAQAATVRGCTIVPSPTPTRHTDCRGMDLRRVNLAGRDLRYADFANASMQRANLAGARLTGARLAQANLTRANLAGATAPGARMTGAGLTRANLSRADLTGARLDGTVLLTHANLTGARLARANLGSAMFLTTTITGADMGTTRLTNVGSNGVVGQPAALPAGWRVVQGRLAGPTANLWGATFSDADLSGIDLSGANLIYVTFLGNSTLRGTPMSGALTDGMTWNWIWVPSANIYATDGGTTTCPDGSAAIPGYASGLPDAPAVGCSTPLP